MSKNIAEHDGIVTAVSQGKVTVKIHSVSACSSCEAHGSCGFAEAKDKEFEIDTPEWEQFQQGDIVTVSIRHSLGFEAVLWAYILPAVILLTSILTLLHFIASEGLAVLISLVVLALYFVVLYQFRDRLQRHFSFGVEHR